MGGGDGRVVGGSRPVFMCELGCVSVIHYIFLYFSTLFCKKKNHIIDMVRLELVYLLNFSTHGTFLSLLDAKSLVRLFREFLLDGQ